MRWVFWISAFVVAYVYVGYPLLLAAWAPLARRRRARAGRRRPSPRPTPAIPTVSIVLAVRDEASALPGRLENLLSLDYPTDRREVIVVSDGSTDATVAVLEGYGDRVRTISLPRVGKAAALNEGVLAASHDLVLFADARQRFAPDALRRLVARFGDPEVGAVSGELVLDAERTPSTAAASPVAEGVGVYWRYEKWIRRSESEVGSVVGATGAIYAIRRALWTPLPPGTLLDDVLAPMRIALGGHRVVFEPGAAAFDIASRDVATEHRRKVRTLAGNYQLIRLEPRLLSPWGNPLFVQFVSHKLGRLVVPYALMALLVSSTALASAGPIYSAALVVQVTFYVLALHGATAAAGEEAPAPRRKELLNAEVD
jgi:cellulose synthase/poly-beta-1,6-N-acetylglucosamine synthase-like glycosyltransferase